LYHKERKTVIIDEAALFCECYSADRKRKYRKNMFICLF